MRRNARRAEVHKIWEDKRFIVSSSIIGGIVVIIMGVIFYSKNDNADTITPNQIVSLEKDDEFNSNTQSASSSIGNTVKNKEESKDKNTSLNNSKETNTVNNNTASNNTNTSNTTNTANTTDVTNTTKKDTSAQNKVVATNSDDKILFSWPVKGDILKAFSADNLLFSSTLQEWTTHNGIDIKADKTSIVTASADGTIKSIKNDPRYGLTVTIEHANGFKTVYSNLLTAEFVVEGEKVISGQTIGTVGNTANFEVADDFHLHFEIIKDSEYVDPMIYLK